MITIQNGMHNDTWQKDEKYFSKIGTFMSKCEEIIKNDKKNN